MTSFEGKVAVVTGGGSGIGRALALALGRAGARVVVADVDETGAAETVRLVAAAGAEGLAAPTDVADRRQVDALADRVFERYGATHVLCNNAGVVVHGGLQSATWQDWEWVLGVNLWGVIHGLLAFVPRMIAGGEGGHVVNTASMAGLIASQGLGVYNTTKYAVVGLSETLAKDLRPHGIGVTVVCPMGVDDAHPRGRAQPADSPAERPGCSGGERGDADRAHARPRGRRGADARGCAGRRAVRDHARRGARAAAPALPAPGGRNPTALASLTPTRATAILSAEP